jgi:hypothetical protein
MANWLIFMVYPARTRAYEGSRQADGYRRVTYISDLTLPYNQATIESAVIAAHRRPVARQFSDGASKQKNRGHTMRKILTSICVAVALSVPAAALTTANASAAPSRPTVRPAVTAPRLAGREAQITYSCLLLITTGIPKGPGLTKCTLSPPVTIRPGQYLYVDILSSPKPASSWVRVCPGSKGLRFCQDINVYGVDTAIWYNNQGRNIVAYALYMKGNVPFDTIYFWVKAA